MGGGVFSLIWKPNAGRFGSWEGTCPFHRGTIAAPRCKKTLGVTAEIGKMDTELLIKSWCTMAELYDRKYKHLEWIHRPNDIDAIIPSELEEAAASMDAPPWDVVCPDEIMDFVEADAARKEPLGDVAAPSGGAAPSSSGAPAAVAPAPVVPGPAASTTSSSSSNSGDACAVVAPGPAVPEPANESSSSSSSSSS